MNEVTIYHQRFNSDANPSYTKLYPRRNKNGIHTHKHVADISVTHNCEEGRTLDEDVVVERLEQAYRLSQNDFSEDWVNLKQRSSMAGDIFVDGLTETHWEVDFCGFNRLNRGRMKRITSQQCHLLQNP
tara:strand:- start:488 stop:874 length:387 start_codon:yes stop_codon:yes gene_type:complete